MIRKEELLPEVVIKFEAQVLGIETIGIDNDLSPFPQRFQVRLECSGIHSHKYITFIARGEDPVT